MTTFSTDPALYIFTSLTAGSSHIVTATSRLETILRANRVPFKAIDIATNDKARMLWGRRAGKDESGRLRKLPGLVQEAMVLGDLVEIEEWNEYGELKQHVKIYYDEHTIPSIHDKPPEPPKKKKATKKSAAKPAAPPDADDAVASSSKATMPRPAAAQGDKVDAANSTALPIRSVADEAAKKAKELRLKSLREKVHGKEAAGDKPKPVGSDPKPDAKPDEGEKKAESSSDPAAAAADLQSPTSGAWKGPAGTPSASQVNAASNSVQSPTSGRWHGSSADLKERAVEATAPEVAKVESDSAIREEPEREREEVQKEVQKAETKKEDEADDVKQG
ncbi:hypothetical protein HIM_07634 [Hirsutella minnesotensis 3608]|uniref:Uncharacterized protein n=1 Tax=Hirsutella minnesotensis 3608 TaxID=1043627 RepID=A0A0F7ZYU1_9HYPO|nr:hypothetical protein HIM_07634 [Hirsutella minnesotensis 3608]